MTTTKKQDNDVIVEAPEVDLEIFNWDKEQACFAGQFIDEENKIEYKRQTPLEQKRWEDFKAKAIDPNNGQWFRSGNGSGRPKENGELPKRIVSSIVRIKAKNGSEYLLTTGKIKAFNQFGDPVFMPYSTPEKYTETIFRFETRPDLTKGYAQRVNVGPSGGTLKYTLPWSAAAAQKLYDLRENDNIDLLVKIQDQNSTYAVKKPNGTLEDNFKLFCESEFLYLFYANYLTDSERILNMRKGQMQGILPQMSEEEMAISLAAQKSLSQIDKHIAVQ